MWDWFRALRNELLDVSGALVFLRHLRTINFSVNIVIEYLKREIYIDSKVKGTYD